MAAASLHAQYVPFQKYTSNNGLISDRITTLTQDVKGVMWFGSYFGICRYDGIKFEKIGLPENQQNKFVKFLLPAHGKMYASFLFNGGLAEISKGQVKSWFISGKDSEAANEFYCMADNGDGSLLLCTNIGQVYKFKHGQFTLLYTLKNNANALPVTIQKDRFNTIWLGTENGLYIIPYPYHKEVVYFNKNNIYSISRDDNQFLWFSRSDGNKIIIEKAVGWQNGGFINRQVIHNSASAKMVPFYGSMSKGFWFIDKGLGLVNISGDNNRVTYKIPFDYSTDMNAVFADRENNIWVANDPGLFKISNFHTKSYLFEEMAASGGSITFANDSDLIISNAKNLYKLAGGKFQKLQTGKSFKSYFGITYKDKHKNLWFGFWNEGLWLANYNKSKLIGKQYFSSFNNIPIHASTIAEDGKGNMWVAGFNGLFYFRDNKVMDQYYAPNASGGHASITSMALDKATQTIWIGDNATGITILKYKLNAGNKIQYEVMGFITADDGLKDTYIRSMQLDHKKNLWVGTRFEGLYRVEPKEKKFNVINCKEEAKLTCARVIDIQVQDSSAVWIATCDGIYRYRFPAKSWNHYNTSNGLLNAEVFSLLVDTKKDIVYTLSVQGITKLQITSVEKTLPPLINMVAINVVGKPDTAALYSQSLTKYPYSKNAIGFSFAGASFIDEKNIRYKYMLQGFDKDWSTDVYTNTVNYASLPPGRYIFKVLAANARNQWSEKPAIFEFEIVQPFYKRAGFFFILISVLIFIIYLVKIQQLKNRFKIEKLRLAIARDLHDDVGSTLGSINLLSKTAFRRLENYPVTEDVKPIFSKIGQSAENTLQAMDDIVWSINPGKDNIHDLIIRMREFAIPLLEAKEIEFDFLVEGNNEQSIPMILRRTIFLIYKEAIHNILKHAGATQVKIKIQVGQKRFLLQISDNGKGFTVPSPSSGNGLKNLYSRAAQTGGFFKIDNLHPGVLVEFSAPLR